MTLPRVSAGADPDTIAQTSCSAWEALFSRSQLSAPGRETRLRRFARILELYRTRAGRLPHIVKVTGTSGKGSVCAMLESIFLRDGKRVCTFTSPHLVSERERIRLCGDVVSSDVWDQAAAWVLAFVDEVLAVYGQETQPSFFETVLLLALEISRTHAVDILLLEVAVGGYHDVVSLFSSELAVITTVGLDHKLELGSTIEEIAADKAGIASSGSTLILGPAIQGKALDVILGDTAPRNVNIVQADSARLTVLASTRSGSRVQIGGLEVTVPLPGHFQLDNFATAVSLFESAVELGWAGNWNSIAGVSNARWPARLELVQLSPQAPAWLIDAGHNTLAFGEIRKYVEEFYSHSRVALVFGASELEKANEGLAILSPVATRIFLATGFHRSAVSSIHELQVGSEVLEKLTFVASPDDAFLLVDDGEAPFDLVVVTGSVFLVGFWKEWSGRERPSREVAGL